MNLLLLKEQDLIEPGVARITDRRLEHLLKIVKSETGDELKVGIEGQNMGFGKVERLSKEELVIRFQQTLPPPPPHPVTLAVALPRPPTLQKVLQSATEMGVKVFHFYQSARVEKSFWQSSKLKPDALEAQLTHGMEQCLDTIRPKIYFHQRFKPFIEDTLPNLISANSPRIVADPSGTQSVTGPAQDGTFLMVGPEGGFVPFELELLQQHGFQAVTLGPRILRVEHAVMKLLSQLGV